MPNDSAQFSRHVKTKGELLAEFDPILAEGETFSYQQGIGYVFIAPKDNAKCQYWLSRTIAFLESFLPDRDAGARARGQRTVSGAKQKAVTWWSVTADCEMLLFSLGRTRL